MDSIFLAVSSNVSPFTTLLEEGEKFTTSALSRFAANSNEVRGPCAGLEKQIHHGFPRRAGTFLISRPLTSLKGSAASRRSAISSDDNAARPRRSFRLKAHTVPSALMSLATRSSSPILQGILEYFRLLRLEYFSPRNWLEWEVAGVPDQLTPLIEFHRRPKSMSPSIAARMVLPVNNTSSTRMILRSENMKRDVRFLEDGLIFANSQVIPIQRNVQLPQDNLRLLDLRK